MLFFLAQGYRVIAHDRRGHGRSTQTDTGNDMDTYAADMAELVAALDLRDAIQVGHSTGGGEVTRYVANHGKGRVAKAVLISAIPPVMLKRDRNPGGTPIEVFWRLSRGARRQARSVLSRCGERPLLRFQPARGEGLGRHDLQLVASGHNGGAKAHYDYIKVFSETDLSS
jgi:non-heme chloroperoxidase